MNIKILKYVKFIISLVLIFLMIVPSYAALSASDGSVFVSKSEFDAAIIDFNSRVTTFEAGINSKIDSQVTSYLDTNGIWSGQYFVDKRVEIFSSDLYARSNITSLLTGTSIDKSKEFYSMYKYIHDKEVGKAGLCYLKISGEGQAICQLYKSSVATQTYMGKQQAIPHLEIRDANTGEILTENRIGTCYWVGPAEGTPAHIRLVNAINTGGMNITFFVRKENILLLDFGFFCTWYTDSDTNGYSGQSMNSPWNFKMYLEPDSAVY